jgi:PadR family transcriptional regulator, regulatory protein PadR
MLGELEQVVMLAVLRVGEGAYGVPIRGEIARQSGRELTLATVYKTLGRLEDKGLVASYVGDPTPQRGGRRKRFYDVTPAGTHALQESVGALRRMTAGLDLGWET